MSYDRKYLILALTYLLFGMSLGIVMAASHNHGQHVTHAHINLVGFLLSLLYGVIHRLWLTNPSAQVAGVQFYLHHVGAVVMFFGLLLLYGGIVAEERIEPLLAISSLSVLGGALCMLYLVARALRQEVASSQTTHS